ncbi:heme oxygenase (biliverdin-producing) [Streptomyces sp. TR06-5]|uniref:biliverdin-producing heme oxygenase n=1 Tax=unclassified Streptomyces TaxID=2593676 RepID=UPI0039A3D8BE
MAVSRQSIGSTPFSVLLRTASQQQHSEAESSRFMTDLLGGALPVTAYRLYTEQLWFVYEALEEAASALADDPLAGAFLDPALLRRPALRRDLDHLHGGDGWRTGARPLPATRAYAERITEVGRSWPGGYVAHHYTRYLGDLSGGQVIRGRAERLWRLPRKGDGVRFYVFEGIGNPAAFKRAYRERLDALPADGPERQRIVDECRRAFRLNTAMFAELADRTAVTA